nr:hypothetical protein [Blautia sp. MSJ-19]
MQKKMQELISKEELDRAFDARFPKNMQRKLRSAKVAIAGLGGLFCEYPIVCEAFDRPDQKAMLVRELLTQCPKTTVISGNGMAGYADINEIKTCQMMQRLYVCGDQSTDVGDGIGLIAPRVSACAAHQANKVLQLVMQAQYE